MSKDLKDMINTVEKNTRSQAELEQTISSLKEEINKLRSTEKEKSLLIESLKSQIKDEEIEKIELPSEIGVLKDIISSQRQDLNEKQNIIEKLNDRIDKLVIDIETSGGHSVIEVDNKELFDAQIRIIQLSDENQEYRNQIKILQNQIDELRLIKTEVDESEEEEEEKAELNEELINVKRLNFNLMEENGLLRVELESFKAKFQERLDEAISQELNREKEKNLNLKSKIDSLKTRLIELNEMGTEELETANELNRILLSELETLKSQLAEINKESSEELKVANDKITVLSAELEDYESQIKYLQTQLRDSNDPIIVSTEEALEFANLREKYDNLKSEISKYKEENQVLKDKIEKLSEKEEIIPSKPFQEPLILTSIPKQIDLSLFSRMYYLFDDNNKKAVIELLIDDLKSEDSEIKRNAIKVLSHIRLNKVYNALLELIDDKDWIVRYNVIKALSKFEKKNEEFVTLLKKLTKDADVDVREIAFKILNDISEAKIL
ncbi:MAG: HEAT repeat domain-containing protein [Promethearchaeota archaeon]